MNVSVFTRLPYRSVNAL